MVSQKPKYCEHEAILWKANQRGPTVCGTLLVRFAPDIPMGRGLVCVHVLNVAQYGSLCEHEAILWKANQRGPTVCGTLLVRFAPDSWAPHVAYQWDVVWFAFRLTGHSGPLWEVVRCGTLPDPFGTDTVWFFEHSKAPSGMVCMGPARCSRVLEGTQSQHIYSM